MARSARLLSSNCEEHTCAERASKGESFAPAPARDATRSGNKALTLSPQQGFSTPVKVASPLSRASSAGAAPPPCALAPVRSSALPPLPPRASSSLPGSPSIYVNKGPSSQHSLPVKRRATSVDRPSSRGCNLFKVRAFAFRQVPNACWLMCARADSGRATFSTLQAPSGSGSLCPALTSRPSTGE